MRLLILALLTTFVSACAISPSSPAICAGTDGLRKAHAAGLLIDGGPVSQDTGERLLTGLKAGCGGVVAD